MNNNSYITVIIMADDKKIQGNRGLLARINPQNLQKKKEKKKRIK